MQSGPRLVGLLKSLLNVMKKMELCHAIIDGYNQLHKDFKWNCFRLYPNEVKEEMEDHKVCQLNLTLGCCLKTFTKIVIEEKKSISNTSLY